MDVAYLHSPGIQLTGILSDNRLWRCGGAGSYPLHRQHLALKSWQKFLSIESPVDTTGSYLHTEIGTIAIDALASNMTPQNPRYQGGALSSDKAWITYNSKNLVWLPSEYRPCRERRSASALNLERYGCATLRSTTLKILRSVYIEVTNELFFFYLSILWRGLGVSVNIVG